MCNADENMQTHAYLVVCALSGVLIWWYSLESAPHPRLHTTLRL